MERQYACGGTALIVLPDSESIEFCYNNFNTPVSTTDANGIVTKYAYNDAGLVTRMERLDGSETLTSLTVVYDGAGRPVSYTDQDGLSKSFERDAFGGEGSDLVDRVVLIE